MKTEGRLESFVWVLAAGMGGCSCGETDDVTPPLRNIKLSACQVTFPITHLFQPLLYIMVSPRRLFLNIDHWLTLRRVQGSVVSTIGGAINAVISAIASVIMAIVGGITAVRPATALRLRIVQSH